MGHVTSVMLITSCSDDDISEINAYLKSIGLPAFIKHEETMAQWEVFSCGFKGKPHLIPLIVHHITRYPHYYNREFMRLIIADEHDEQPTIYTFDNRPIWEVDTTKVTEAQNSL